MSLQLLLETHEAVTSLKSIESANLFGGQRSTIVILPHSVVLINVSHLDSQLFDYSLYYSLTMCYTVHESSETDRHFV